MTITMVGNRYYVETESGRLHILNMRSLTWNLKHTYGMSGSIVKRILVRLEISGSVVLERAS